MRFTDRAHAGRQLARRVAALDLTDPVVLALPRGGVPVAAEIAARLQAPLEVFVARKIGHPSHEEYGIGAVAEGLPEPVGLDTEGEGLSAEARRAVVSKAWAELDRRVQHYRDGRELPNLRGADVVLVDDGLATGVTAEAALRALRGHEPRRLVLAVPVCARDTRGRIAAFADDVVCAHIPPRFGAVGLWYRYFKQVTDDEVLEILAASRAEAGMR